jgi:hypothetical protein
MEVDRLGGGLKSTLESRVANRTWRSDSSPLRMPEGINMVHIGASGEIERILLLPGPVKA